MFLLSVLFLLYFIVIFLADAFIQRDLQLFVSMCVPWELSLFVIDTHCYIFTFGGISF